MEVLLVKANDNIVINNNVVRIDNLIEVDNDWINSSVIDTNLIVNEDDDLDLLDISDNNISVMTSEQVFWYNVCKCIFNLYFLRLEINTFQMVLQTSILEINSIHHSSKLPTQHPIIRPNSM